MADKKRSKIAKDIKGRVWWLYFLLILTCSAIIVQILVIQFGPSSSELRKKSVELTFERIDIEADRGDVLAGDGRLLATSVPIYEIRMDFGSKGLDDQTFNEQVDSLAHCLALFFKDKSKSSYKSMLVEARRERAKNRYKQISPRRVDYVEEQQIKNFPIFRRGANKGGYISVKIDRRLKPHGALASRTIGVSNEGGVKYGVEGAFDEQLRGEKGRVLMQRISGNFRVPVNDPANVEPVNGKDILTTLNVEIQDVAQSALESQLKRHNADWGTVVLMEVATGEIHAMANLTRRGDGECVEDFNYAIGRRMEPGSTFKLATLIALIEDAGMSVDEEIDCENGVARVGNRVIRDTHEDGVLPLRDVFGVSSNIGFAKAVHEKYSSNPSKFVDFIGDKLRFSSPTGVQIGGEREPLIKDPKNRDTGWDGTSLVMMSHGYALEVTPIQTLALYNAVANDGRMVQPLLIKGVQSYGHVVESYQAEVLRSAIGSKKTIEIVRDCLENVVDAGTGGVLKSPYYSVAAKTGTAQLAFDNGGYSDARGGRNYLATMVGYFPADNPKYSCIVAMKTYFGAGRWNQYYGAPLAGPVFKAIADRVYASNPSWHEAVNVGKGERVANNISNGRSSELRAVSKRLPMAFEVSRRVREQWVTFGQDSLGLPVPKFVDVDYMASDAPSVVGMGLKDALYMLENSGYRVSFEGRGRVVSQSPKGGVKLEKGGSVKLILK